MMDKTTKFNLWYVFFAIWGVMVLHSAWVRATQITQIPYSEFQTYLKAGQIEEIRISQHHIQGKFREPKENQPLQFTTVRVEPGLADTLSTHNVRFAGEIESTLLRDLLSWIVPTVIFLGLWILLIRRFAGQQGMGGGFMAIGKSKAKIYVEKDVKVTFAEVAGGEEAKAERQEVIEFRKTPEKFHRLGGKIPK
ncbi:MAG: cell division protein FtsH, partial [Deltaproteobacteria bacterium]|nr:cell division protein FtsH [Deltaproteobacteria bacterium]